MELLSSPLITKAKAAVISNLTSVLPSDSSYDPPNHIVNIFVYQLICKKYCDIIIDS